MAVENPLWVAVWIGKSLISGSFSIAMFDYGRVIVISIFNDEYTIHAIVNPFPSEPQKRGKRLVMFHCLPRQSATLCPGCFAVSPMTTLVTLMSWWINECPIFKIFPERWYEWPASAKRLHNYGNIHHVQWKNSLWMAKFYVRLPDSNVLMLVYE